MNKKISDAPPIVIGHRRRAWIRTKWRVYKISDTLSEQTTSRDVQMLSNKYTLVGSTTAIPPQNGTHFFVHVESATSDDDAKTQLLNIYREGATMTVLDGHVEPPEGVVATVLIAGQLRSHAAPGADEGAPEAFEHHGIRIYPAAFKGEPRWCVQAERNRGTTSTFGDTIHPTPDSAKQEAYLQFRRAESQNERAIAAQADVVAHAAKKDANKGLSIAERRSQALLDGPTKLHPNAGLGTGTCREAMQKAVMQGRLVEMGMIRDTAAKKRDVDRLESARRMNCIPNLTNPNLPGMKEVNEAYARVNTDHYEKPEYRVFDGPDDKGTYRVITKIEYDYVQALQGDPVAMSKLRAASDASFVRVRNELAKSWDPKHLDGAGKPLIASAAAADVEQKPTPRSSFQRPSPFTP